MKLSQVKNLEKMQLKGLRIFYIVNSSWYFTYATAFKAVLVFRKLKKKNYLMWDQFNRQ